MRPRDPTVRRVLAVAVVALLARVVALGTRVAHFDEGRVAYWTLRYIETGTFQYRPILHGPFLQQVNRVVFQTVGATDATMRVVVALVGTLLPLSALLLRHRLSDRETLALALLLAFDPTLLYYSRFARADVPVAAFAFLAFCLFVRAVDTGRVRHVVAGLGLFALALTAKENALTYPVSWLGALVLLVDHRALAVRARGDSLRAWARSASRRVRRAVRPFATGAVPGLLLALAVLVAFYAPRDPTAGAVSIGNAIANPGLWPAVLEAATVGAAESLYRLWVAPASRIEGAFGYPVLFGALLKDLALASLALSVLAVVGFVVERYAGPQRDLPLFGFYWGVTALLGYPAIADIPGPWLAVHLLVPLALPAAVGAVWLAERARNPLAGTSTHTARAAGLVLLLATVQVGGTAAYTSYAAPEGPHELAQYAQPRGEFGPAIAATERAARTTDPPHVLVYGEGFVDGGAQAFRQPACAAWIRVLPWPWYFARANATVTCAADASGLPDRLPPVVVANASRPLPPTLLNRTADWNRFEGTMRQGRGRVVMFVDTSRVPERKSDVSAHTTDG